MRINTDRPDFRGSNNQLMSKSRNGVNFETALVTSGGKPLYHYLLVEKDWVEPLGFTGNIRRVVCTINGTLSIQCSLLPNGKGAYYISLNKDYRDRLRIAVGDAVYVELVRDESKYRLFHKLTNGKQRTILYYVAKAKDVDRRIHAALVIVEHLKSNDGKLDHHKLYEEMKRPVF